MDSMQWLALGIFAVTIVVVITNWIDGALAALIGVSVMIWLGIMTEVDAFNYVDWNVMAILISIWIIAHYFGRSGVPSWLSVQAMTFSGGRPGFLVMILAFLAGIISMFVDNVVTILMMAPVALPLARALKIPATPLVLMIGFAANFMGTALLLGDLPPQMLHSVSGVEFGGFIWHSGRPSSFPILMVTFFITLGAMYWYGFRGLARVSLKDTGVEAKIDNPLFASVVVGWFLLTVFAMAFREVLNVKLGFIALTGAISLVLILELLGERVKKEAGEFEEAVQGLEWKAIFFYVALFALVGGLEKTKIIEQLAHAITPLFSTNYALGATLFYWITIPIVGLVEHDAYILTFLYAIRDLKDSAGVEPWPLWWMLVWAGTLGSNLTIAGAPALYVALTICEKEEDRKVSLREFLSWSIPFTLIASFVCYVLGMLIWVLPFAK
jgi:Na+/H+ antiporter NhaD/arsenite permease-like protein